MSFLCIADSFRIAKVPAKDWTPGYQQFDEALEDYLKKLTDKSLCRGEVVDKASCRPLYLYKGSYPSTVSSDRGQTWLPSNLQGSLDQLAAWGDESIITGYIPQVYSPTTGHIRPVIILHEITDIRAAANAKCNE